MKIKYTLVLLAFLVVISSASAQSAFTFKVLVSKGKAEIKSGANWSVLKVGTSLKENDEVKVAENSYLGLIHSNGRPLEIKEAGSYKVSELASRLGKAQSVMSKYTDFILSSTDAKQSRLTATGAVHRGTENSIALYLPDAPKYKTYGDRAVIGWSALPDATKYIVIVRNLFEEELGRFEVSTNSYELDMSKAPFASENELLVKILSANSPTLGSREIAIHRQSPNERALITKAMEDFGPDIKEETALNKFILAGFFEEKYLLVDALTAYQDAMRLAPDVTAYKDAYQDFLKRAGFVSESKKK